jgi:hypothetical protein
MHYLVPTPREIKMPAWQDPRPTALIVLADGTVVEGTGIGAEGSAAGEPRRGPSSLYHRHLFAVYK